MEAVAELDRESLDGLIALVRKHTGIAMNERKRVLLQSRLGPRMRALGLESYAAYIERVRQGGAEVQQFVNMVTTNDTLFFRTPAVWTWLAQWLPQWHAAHPGKTMRIWSAAAASGEEACSIAMLCEQYRERAPDFRYQVLGTDISTEVLEVAARGSYSGRSVERLAQSHPQLMARFFSGSDGSICATAELKANVRFTTHNLLEPMARAAPFDLVFLRNVLIYFDDAHQKAVLANVHRQMAAGARMVLGEQESITRLDAPFKFELQHVYSPLEALP